MSATIKLRPAQGRVFQSPARFRVLVAGRRFGKTYLAIPELIRMAWGPGKLAWYGAPYRWQAKQIAWKALKQMAAPYFAGKPNETDLSVQLISGGTIALRGMENYDAQRGPGLDGLVLDEYADMDPAAWKEVLRPMLADRLGRALFIGTPEGFNHFYDLYDRARSGEPNWAAWQFTTAQGGNVPLEEIEAARRDLDEKTFRQEFEASFENIGSGRVYYAFSRESNVGEAAFNPRLPICWTLDFNIDPMCSVIAQIDGQRVNVLQELILPDSSTHDACAAFLDRAGRYLETIRPLQVNVYGDATGANRQHAGPSDWQILREFFSRTSDRFRATWHVRAANPAIKDRTAAVNARLRNHAGQSHLVIDRGCRELIADMEQVMWATDAAGQPLPKLDGRNPKRTHVSDALGYLIEKEFGLRVFSGLKSQWMGA